MLNQKCITHAMFYEDSLQPYSTTGGGGGREVTFILLDGELGSKVSSQNRHC